MPKPYPQEFRDDVVAVARKGQAPLNQIAKDFGDLRGLPSQLDEGGRRRRRQPPRPGRRTATSCPAGGVAERSAWQDHVVTIRRKPTWWPSRGRSVAYRVAPFDVDQSHPRVVDMNFGVERGHRVGRVLQR